MNNEITAPKQSRSFGELMEIIDQVIFWEVVIESAPTDKDSSACDDLDPSGEDGVPG